MSIVRMTTMQPHRVSLVPFRVPGPRSAVRRPPAARGWLSPVLAVLLSLTWAARGTAQDRQLPSVPQSLGLQEAIDLATQYNPTYRQAENDHAPAAWGVRNAVAATFMPSLTVSGGAGYSGAGSQTFLNTQFSQGSGTLSSSYTLQLQWQLSGRTLSQPGLAKAQLHAADASITNGRMSLRSAIVNQYLAVLQAEENVRIAEAQQKSADEALRLAQARYQVGQTTVLDVRQAEVKKGQADVLMLQAQQAVTVQKLTLFQQMGVAAPDDPSVVSLPDTFPVVEPTWKLDALLTEADQHNPDLTTLKARETAAKWSARAAKSAWLPTLSFSAGWSGYSQQYTNVQYALDQATASAQANYDQCNLINNSLLNPGATPLDCGSPTVTPAVENSIRAQNSVFPFSFTGQPFQARVSVSLPIFTQFSRPLEVSQAQAQTDDAREQVRARSLQVRTDVSSAYYQLQTAYQTIGIQQTNRGAAQEQLRLATEQYRVGSGTFLNLLDAQTTAQQAEFDYIRAVYDYHRAIVALETAVGRALR
jgi:outer membrane protein